MSSNANTGGGGGVSSEDGQEEQDDDPSSSPSLNVSSDSESEDVDEEVLETFRKEWKQELMRKHKMEGGKARLPSGVIDSTQTSGEATPTNEKMAKATTPNVHDDILQRAKDLFLSGIHFEQKGMMHEAIRGYNQAVHLVPDIEHRLYDQVKLMQTSKGSSQLSGRDSPICVTTCVEQNENQNRLFAIFESRIANMPNGGKKCCTPAKDVQGQVHLSQLPTEVLLHILRWAISVDLDMKSLETMSMVCAGLYVLCRRGDLWKCACKQLWGVRTGQPDANFPTYRSMYIFRPHLLFNGVYISKITYIRHGEVSFQDHDYRPWHMVVYYRYLRFFTDGTMHKLTTADDPYTVLPYLKSKTARYQGLLTGKYGLIGKDCIAFKVLRVKNDYNENQSIYPYSRHGKGYMKTQPDHEPLQHQFEGELQIESLKHRKHAKLVWRNYEVTVVYRSGHVAKTEMDIDDQKFPNAIFSRVKSYTSQSEAPLMA